MNAKTKKILKISGIALIAAFTITLNSLATTVFDNPLRIFLLEQKGKEGNLDIKYNEADYNATTLTEKKEQLAKDITKEGTVLLKKEGDYMPYKEGTEFSFFSSNSIKLTRTTSTLKDEFTKQGFKVNEKLWNFYQSGKGSTYKRGTGSIDYGDGMDYSINECPLSVIKDEKDLESSFKGTKAVFVFTRICGEGVDPARGMYSSSKDVRDFDKNYLEPDSTELEIIDYLNKNFDDVTLLLNSSNPIELGWVNNYSNIHNILSISLAGAGLESLPKIMKGEINPSGRTVDTYASDLLSSPAAVNIGDFSYMKDGKEFANYVTYKEGIYVGYKYYESRYEDVVLEQGNAGSYSYKDEVTYPFGYGLSYTDFSWTDYKCEFDQESKEIKNTVKVTNTGKVKGKDVVELFAQKPYTTFDKTNGIEKASVELVGFEKTKELEPNESQEITISINREDLKSYDSLVNKTYILEKGDYYLSLGKNSHDAINNILAKKYKTTSNSTIDTNGNVDLVSTINFDSNSDLSFDSNGVDSKIYSKDRKSDKEITNQLDFATKDDIHYLSRNDWKNTWPTPYGNKSNTVSKWGNQVNGVDSNGNPTSYLYTIDISNEDATKYSQTGKNASLNPNLGKKSLDITTSAKNGVELIDLRGKDYSDPLWNDLLDNLSENDYTSLIATSGYGTLQIDSINCPATNAKDAANGLIVTKAKVTMPNIIAVSSTYNKAIAEEFGSIVAEDGLIGSPAGKIHGWYSPACNIHRSPFTARSHEYPSEDPYLSGIITSKEAIGAVKKGMYVHVKHFAFNEQDLHRGDRHQGGLVTWLNEQSAREIYLKPFEMVSKCEDVTQFYYQNDEKTGKLEKVEYKTPVLSGVMSSFNRVGYTWAGGCYPLLTNILREEWAFNGYIITDFDNGGFMDTEQSIYAGADAKLNPLNACNWTFSKKNKEDAYYARESVHHMLYTISNSFAMNGITHGLKVSKGFPNYAFILIAVDALALAGVTLLAISLVKSLKKKED